MQQSMRVPGMLLSNALISSCTIDVSRIVLKAFRFRSLVILLLCLRVQNPTVAGMLGAVIQDDKLSLADVADPFGM